MDWLFLSFSGRLTRLPFWLGTLALGIVQSAAMFFLFVGLLGGFGHLTPPELRVALSDFDEMRGIFIPLATLSLAFMYPTLALYTKRWHDRGKSGWWTLISLVPVIGGFWLLIELGFLGGDEGDNIYGPNPAYA